MSRRRVGVFVAVAVSTRKYPRPRLLLPRTLTGVSSGAGRATFASLAAVSTATESGGSESRTTVSGLVVGAGWDCPRAEVAAAVTRRAARIWTASVRTL